MRRLILATALVSTVASVAGAEEVEVEGGGVVETTSYGPGKVEGGLFLGGFINNYFHQFYDPDLEGRGVVELEKVSPELGIRFAVFPSRFLGFEIEGAVVGANREDNGDGVTIYGLGGQLILQQPGRITPFIGVGGMFRHSRSETLGNDQDGFAHLVGGLRFWLSQTVALRIDGRFSRGPSYPHPDTSFNASYGEFTVGLSFNGKSTSGSAVVVEKPVDPDSDKDGVLGMADECPTEKGEGNEDGCPTRDKDGDGIADKADKCVDQAETMNKFEDTDGCPDAIPDTDGDGLDDTVDKCKDQPEDKDTFEDEDGCPDPDNDADGVLDAKDKCPGETGPIENLGCPDTDKDGDGVVDRLDNCPEEKGDAKNQGCKAKQLVVITKDQLKILDQVKFVTGSAKLSRASNKLLDNIARVLLSHLEIWKVRVEGHTDNVGKPAKNLKLSQDRAESVVKYLTKKGVAAERLEATGYGDTKPLEDNKTAKGKAANRRVEFNIATE
jgi:outer membrane protein OmpA-like peptidoglycan-associated protein